MDTAIAFQQAMEKMDLVCSELPIPDSTIHRFHVEGDRPGTKNGWYVLYPGDLPAGAFGSWKNGFTYKWCAKRMKDLSDAERTEHQQRVEQAKTERDKARREAAKCARKRAQQIWDAAQPAPTDHPYLIKKGIGAHELRIHKSTLVIPMRDTDETLRSLQFISPDGQKRFLTDGEIKRTSASSLLSS